MGLFSEIPRHNQADILKKLDFIELTKFLQTSHEAAEISKNFSHRLNLKLDIIAFKDDPFRSIAYLPVEALSGALIRLEIEQFYIGFKISDEKLYYLQEFCQKTKLVTKELSLYAAHEKMKNDPSMVDNLIKLLNVKSLILHSYSSSDLSSLNELENVNKIEFTNGEMKETDFLQMDQPEIRVSFVYPPLFPSKINRFFKQWTEGQRQLKRFSTEVGKEFMEIFSGLEFTILWSSESPKSNTFDPIFAKDADGMLLKIITLERSADKKKLFVAIWEDRFDGERLEAEEYEDEEDIQEWIRGHFVEC